MKFRDIHKVHSGHYIHRYDITYETSGGNIKTYEMISRNPDMKTIEDLHNEKADAVVMILFDESHERLLLNQEYRMAVGDWIYNFPAGLIEPGESMEEAARRELTEETGLTLVSIDDVVGKCYSAIGFSNETNVCLIGTATGAFTQSDSEYEEIRTDWYTKDQVKKLLETEQFGIRAQIFCYLWSRNGLK
ncbi:MAG: NUDIX hydrolase [Lachnospiraceae bacterium]|nr:NUDIX hydrolase [Lachnospiraceae bacterium]